MDIVTGEPEIIRILRVEEHFRKFQNQSQYGYEDIQCHQIPDETICFADDAEDEIETKSPSYDVSAVEEIEEIEQSSFKSAEDIVLYLDSSGKVTAVNGAALTFSGLAEKELVEKLFWNLPGVFGKINASNICEAFDNTANLDVHQIFFGELTDAAGKRRFIKFSVYPLHGSEGIQYVLIIGRDFTEQKRMEKKLRESGDKFRALAEYFEMISDTTIALGRKDLFSNVSDVIFQVSPDGMVTYINSAIGEIAGYMPEDIIGSSFTKILPKKDWKRVRKEFFSRTNKTDMMDREIHSFETCIVHKDGHIMPAEINGKLIKPGLEVIGRKSQLRIQGSIRDITERKKAEEELQRSAERLREINEELTATNEELSATQDELSSLNEELELKVGERTAEVEKILKQKDEFIIQLGHDLKSPLTPLIGLLPMVEEQEKDPKLKELIKVSNRNVKFMKDLVVKTLQLERLKSPTVVLNLDDLNLLEVVGDITENKKIMLKRKEINVENKIKKKIVVQSDPLQLKELFDNLLTNAIKFTLEGGKISIDATKDKHGVTVSVKDTGIGMNQQQINRIFDDFYKVDSARHDLESSGLGLPICKRIVEKHGGKIWVESPGLGKGTTLYFTLPLNSKK